MQKEGRMVMGKMVQQERRFMKRGKKKVCEDGHRGGEGDVDEMKRNR